MATFVSTFLSALSIIKIAHYSGHDLISRQKVCYLGQNRPLTLTDPDPNNRLAVQVNYELLLSD